MRFVLILMMGWGAPALAQDTPPAAQVEQLPLQDIIRQQLDAFNARDVDLAWTFASPMIQGMFGNPGNFGVMVSEGYPMVWDNSAAKFMAQREVDGRIYQQVMVQDTNGALHVLEYAMIQTAQGWKIDGVSVLPPPDVGV
ncbi:DUF4864 domain-containing protein [Loktanella salsilacus]|uniref:DUF4864 domain-containing protein n=1 Tax=Loktanella salsilacus TaxID=195913 RepID=UPI0020B7300F|nr:DUF4864 domain-containing protein [Loktanella salsilacus]MBU0780375.1 DUF4864 domain-containing protein [Alphaproteobacteria bacterium]UTH47436.1 DUF4864 domain-containing protein [Loktanella salsilacus]